MDYLTLDANGWSHPFISENQGFMRPRNCILCGQESFLHNEKAGSSFSPILSNYPKEFVCASCYQRIDEHDLVLLKC